MAKELVEVIALLTNAPNSPRYRLCGPFVGVLALWSQMQVYYYYYYYYYSGSVFRVNMTPN